MRYKRLVVCVLIAVISFGVVSCDLAGLLDNLRNQICDNTGNILETCGAAWNVHDSKTTHALNAVDYGGSTWVAVGYNSGGSAAASIVTSTNGTTWTAIDGISDNLYDVYYAASTWVAVGSVIYTSTDGSDWTTVVAPSALYKSVYYANQKWVAVGDDKIITSTDGTSWTESTASGVASTDSLNSVFYGNGTWIAVGEKGAVFTSSDGDTWAARNSGIRTALNTVYFGGGRWVAGGDSGVILVSNNSGLAWERRSIGNSSTNFFASYFGAELGDTWFVIGRGNAVYASTNTTDWLSFVISSLDTKSINDALSEFGYVGDAEELLGENEIPEFNDAEYGASRLVGVGNNGIIFSVEDPEP